MGIVDTFTATIAGSVRNTLGYMRAVGAPWLGPKLSRDKLPAYYLGREKVKATLAGVAGQFWWLPFIDTYTQETEAIRRHYPTMLRDPTIKAAVFSKLFNVASLDIDVQPDGDGPRAKKVAAWVRWALLHSRGGLRGLVENTCLPACVNGWSVAEKVWAYVERSEWRGNVGLASLKAKDPTIYRLGEDQYRNVGGVWSTLKAMEWIPIANFVYTQHMPLYGAAVGTSDFRAAYRDFWMIDTSWKLRMIHLEKYGSGMLVGKYADANTDKAPLDAALAQAKASTYMTIPESAIVEALDLAQKGTADYESAIRDLQHSIFLGICFATLQSLEGAVSGARAASQVHRDMSELPTWYVGDLLTGAINDQLVPDLVDLNYAGAGYPLVSIGGINDTELKVSLEIDIGLRNEMGLALSKKEIYRKYRRQPPDDLQDALDPPPPGSPQPPGLGGMLSLNGNGSPSGNGQQGDDAPRPQLQEGDEEQQFDDDAGDEAEEMAEDASGHEHKGNGPGGGQFAPTGVGGHNVKLPKNRRKINISHAATALHQMGYTLGSMNTSHYDPKTKVMTYELTHPDGSKSRASVDEIKEIVYRGASPAMKHSEDEDTDDMADPVPKAEAGPAPAKTGDVALAGKDGAAADRLLAGSIRKGSAALNDLAETAVRRLLKSGNPQKAKTLFNANEREQLADALAACNSTADLLGRSRIQDRAEKVKSGVKLFAEDATPFERFDENPVNPLPPRKALDYFLKLFPSLDVRPERFGPLHERAAFTLARATDKELLGRVQGAIAEALASGEVRKGQDTVNRLLDAAGVGDTRDQYSEMVFRTNMMDSYNSGAQRELASGSMAELFPVWKYLGIRDGRQGKDHEPHFDRYYDSSKTFSEVRGPRVFNCRCSFAPVMAEEWAELQAKGQRVTTFAEDAGGHEHKGKGPGGGQFAPKGGSSDSHVASWASRAKELPAAVAAKAKSYVADKYAKLEQRYGGHYAKAIMAAGLLGIPLPVPGSSILTAAPLIAIAELHRRLSPAMAHAELSNEHVKELGRAFVGDLRKDWTAYSDSDVNMFTKAAKRMGE